MKRSAVLKIVVDIVMIVLFITMLFAKTRVWSSMRSPEPPCF